MKKILFSTLCVAGALTVTSCDDYLETSSPSIVDADFVFSNTTTGRAALDGAYEDWRDCGQNYVFGDGLYYAADVAGSDIERHPEGYTAQPARHNPEGFYENGATAGSYTLGQYDKDQSSAYAKLFSVIGKANAIITAIESASYFDEVMNAGEPSEISQMYGEAVALRATAYRELIRYYGDVPYVATFGVPAAGLDSRDYVYDVILEDLKRVEPLMFEVGGNKNTFSRTYVQGLIGRMSLEAGGYHTRRGDITPINGKGETLTIETTLPTGGKTDENNGATYGRRSDWATLYEQAKTYFKMAIDNPGAATFHLTDPRAAEKNGRVYDNPHQYFFQQMHEDDAIYADESIYEYPMQLGGGNDARPYSFGRPSNGGSKNAYPCKNYGQGRINPAYYYGMFDPSDKRRDVAATVTGSDGKGNEMLISFAPGSKSSAGGISYNKWDENRQAEPWVKAQRKSGVNGPYMRMAEIYLGYAEACAALDPNSTEAKTYLALVRERSFPAGEAKTDEFIQKCGGLHRAVIEERGFEFAGEGDRRWTLIRSGYIVDAVLKIKDLTEKMIAGLAANDSYTFENGNVISSHIWTKAVDAKSLVGFRLTAHCTDATNPVLFPGWRGQHDDWTVFGASYGDNPTPNLAIKGLFAPVSADEAAALEAEGYSKVEWGKTLVDNKSDYSDHLFTDFDGTKAPIYLWPLTENVMLTGGLTNGYGFKGSEGAAE